MCIVVRSSGSFRRICTEDLSRMYYYHKKGLPPVPTYIELSEAEEFQHMDG